MSAPETWEPLVVEFTVAVPASHAFDTWVTRQDLWWPRSHTLSGDPLDIVVEPFVGGRIFERDRSGAEHTWGTILVWEEPVRLGFAWHLVFPPDEATRVDITFEAAGDTTLVRLVQTGWEALGELAGPRRDGNQQGWAAVTAAYRSHLDTDHESRNP